jgi:flagellar hook assembly protein FlgD
VALIAALTVAALLAATAGAMVLTQHLRAEGPVVSNIFFKVKRPAGQYKACFSLTRDDTVQVEMVDGSGHVVRILAPAQPLQGGDNKSDAHCYGWDGTDEAGNPVAPGTYYLRFELRDADRVATSGEHLVIHPPGGSS